MESGHYIRFHWCGIAAPILNREAELAIWGGRSSRLPSARGRPGGGRWLQDATDRGRLALQPIYRAAWRPRFFHVPNSAGVCGDDT
jgi:hypothetical protein